MVLVDTSAWIASFKKVGDPQLREYLKVTITSGKAATSPIIVLELLQGCRTNSERDALRNKLENLEVLDIPQAIWERSYELGFSLRRNGLTIPTADLIIAAAAIENDCILLHQDEHYEMIAQYFSPLGTKKFY